MTPNEVKQLEFAKVTYSEDENSATVGSVKVVAAPLESGDYASTCQGCLFRVGFTCPMWRLEHDGSKCISFHRKDGRPIVWKLAP